MCIFGALISNLKSYYEGLICIRPWVDGFICICAIFGGFSYFSFIWSCVSLSLYCMMSLMTKMLSSFWFQPLIFVWWPWGSSSVFMFFRSRLVYIYKGLIDVVLWSISPGKYKSKLSLNFLIILYSFESIIIVRWYLFLTVLLFHLYQIIGVVVIFEEFEDLWSFSVFENCLSVCVCVSWVSVHRTLSLFCQESVASSCSSLLILIKCLSSEGIYLYFAQLAFAVAV